MSASSPIIGITADVSDNRLQVSSHYASMIVQAGGTPVVLPPHEELVDRLLEFCDGVVLTGGDDPIMTHWGIAMHPKAKPIDERRQAFELRLLQRLDKRDEMPVLGVCLGMQLMGLHHGGTLDQYLPDSLATAGMHWDHGEHEVAGTLGSGMAHSHHRQALSSTGKGRLSVVAHAPDGVIEAVELADRPAMYLGVQWHPERTSDEALGLGLFRRLVAEAAAAAH